MRRVPEPIPVDKFPEEIRKFIELDRKIYDYLFLNKEKEDHEIVTNHVFLEMAADAFTEEQVSIPRTISFGEFIIETLETFTFK